MTSTASTSYSKEIWGGVDGEKESTELKKKDEKGTFLCYVCGLNETYDYFGVKPYFCRNIIFDEPSYVMRDPFQPQKDNTANFLLLGSKCSICKNMVCQDCGIYYSSRFCLSCFENHKNSFPHQVSTAVKKKKSNTNK